VAARSPRTAGTNSSPNAAEPASGISTSTAQCSDSNAQPADRAQRPKARRILPSAGVASKGLDLRARSATGALDVEGLRPGEPAAWLGIGPARRGTGGGEDKSDEGGGAVGDGIGGKGEAGTTACADAADAAAGATKGTDEADAGMGTRGEAMAAAGSINAPSGADGPGATAPDGSAEGANPPAAEPPTAPSRQICACRWPPRTTRRSGTPWITR